MLVTYALIFLLAAVTPFAEGRNEVLLTFIDYVKDIDSSCCIILHTPEQFHKDSTNILSLVKRLARDFSVDITVTALSFSRFLELYKARKDYMACKSPVILIFHSDEDTRKSFSCISHQLPMYDLVWFIIGDGSINSWFQDVHVPFSSAMLVSQRISASHIDLYELYRVTPDRQLRYPKLGNWTTENGLNIDREVVYNRRHNLEGMVFRTGSTQNEPMHSFQAGASGEVELVGYFPEVWKQLAIILNFTSVHYPSVDNVTGIKEGNTWNGLIGMLIRNDIDVAVSEFIMDGQRSHVVDFTRPLVKTSYQIFFKHVGANYNWDAILRPFHTEIWIALLIWVLSASVMMFFLHSTCCNFGMEPVDNKSHFSFINTFFFHVRAICSQGHPVIPKTLSCRILFVCAYVVNGLLVPSYSAYLISYLTFRTPRRPFDDLKGLLQDGTYKLQTNAKTAEYTYFSEATDSTLQRIYKELIVKIPPEDFPLNTQEALDRVCADSHLAHFGDMAVAYYYLNVVKLEKQCDIVTLSKGISTVYSSMALQKGSPYRMAINHFLQRMEDHGLVDRILAASFPLDKNLKMPSNNNVEMMDVAQTFILLGLGMLLAVFIFIGEVFYARRRLAQVSKIWLMKKNHRVQKLNLMTRKLRKTRLNNYMD